MVGFRVDHLPLPGGAPASKNRVALTTSTPFVRRAVLPGEGATREAQPCLAFSTAEAEIRVVPRLMRRFGGILNHNGEDAAL